MFKVCLRNKYLPHKNLKKDTTRTKKAREAKDNMMEKMEMELKEMGSAYNCTCVQGERLRRWQRIKTVDVV